MNENEVYSYALSDSYNGQTLGKKRSTRFGGEGLSTISKHRSAQDEDKWNTTWATHRSK